MSPLRVIGSCPEKLDPIGELVSVVAEEGVKKGKLVTKLAIGSVAVGACIGTGVCAAVGTAVISRLGPKHLLDPLVRQLGSQRAVVTAVLEAVELKLPQTASVHKVIVNVAGKTVHVQVFIENGVMKVNDFWIPR